MRDDVLVVGYGPVGQVTAILLAQRGWRVTVVEKWSHAYPMPRATSFDGESARILAGAGIGDRLGDVGEPTRDYTWRNADGVVLVHVDVDERGWSCWPDSTSMYQPGLEAALATRAAALPNLRVLRGYEAIGVTDRGSHVDLTVGTPDGERVLSADWLVGCDGANSVVRGAIAGGTTDFQFRADWLTCDVVLHEPSVFEPNNVQICDPERPRSAISAGPGHRRWEFMRVPGESMEQFGAVDNVWRLLGLFGIDSTNATLERHAVYTFQARYANRWREGRLLVAGDAAHLMPPFAGQGLCSGLRDAANLTWKLDLVLRGLAGAALLDSYTVERTKHVHRAIGISMNLGRVIGQTDPAAARERDQVMIAARARGVGSARGESAVAPLVDGMLHRGADGRPVAPAGALTPQGRVAIGDDVGLFDELVGRGFALVSAVAPDRLLDAERLAFLDAIGTRLVHVLPAGDPTPDGVVDIEGVYLRYLATTGVRALLVRPDHYVFGGATTPVAVAALVDDLRRQLSVHVLAG